MNGLIDWAFAHTRAVLMVFFVILVAWGMMALSDAHVNILSATLSTTRDRVAKSRFSFEMADAAHLDGVLRAVRAVPGVFDAYRVTS